MGWYGNNEPLHIVAGTGHGKTQLMQMLMTHERTGFCVIDSQGDMLEKISKRFSPNVLYIDPTDIEFPPALNMFDMDMEEGSRHSEMILNATVSLYEYFFGALLGAELTQRQKLIFGYLARLMLVIPHANIHTLLEVMEDTGRYTAYISKLSGTARKFFETQFNQKKFNATKDQIASRLYGVLENDAFDRLFSAKENKVDIFAAMNDGNIVLINTAKNFFQKDRSAIIGRFFIALITQAAIRRATIPEEKRLPYFVYIDEAHEYFDEHIEDLLNQARKYKVGLILAHQNLNQLNDKLRASIMASTSIKLAGGVSGRDARYFAQELGCSVDTIQQLEKDREGSQWLLSVKGTGTGVVESPFGVLEAIPEMPKDEYASFLMINRQYLSMAKKKQGTKADDELRLHLDDLSDKTDVGRRKEDESENDDFWE